MKNVHTKNQEGKTSSVDHKRAPSSKKIEANRRNSLRSTGPKTSEGKSRAKWNALKHGLLSRMVIVAEGPGKENREDFLHLLQSLREDLQPVGTLEEVLVEKIAVEYWRFMRVIRCENAAIRLHFVPEPPECRALDIDLAVLPPSPSSLNILRKRANINSEICLPIEQFLRYETSINRQLFQAISQLERVQRLRKGEAVPAPISVDVSGEPVFYQTKPTTPSESTEAPKSSASSKADGGTSQWTPDSPEEQGKHGNWESRLEEIAPRLDVPMDPAKSTVKLQ
jgi:hypothetical protein